MSERAYSDTGTPLSSRQNEVANFPEPWQSIWTMRVESRPLIENDGGNSSNRTVSFRKMPPTNMAIEAEMGQPKADDLFPLALTNLTYIALDKQVLLDSTLRLGATGVTILLGPNGAGKSLLLRCLHGLLKPASGSILWNGNEPDDAIHARQAMVFQKPVLLRRSVAANMDFALNAHGPGDPAFRDELLAAVDLLDQKAQPARLLSGGEQQRLALARALATRPDILFLDEPTANLDPASTLVIETMIRQEVAAGTKIIFVTHDIGQAKRLADDIVFLHRGHVLEQSAAPAFFEKPRTKEAANYLGGQIVL